MKFMRDFKEDLVKIRSDFSGDFRGDLVKFRSDFSGDLVNTNQ